MRYAFENLEVWKKSRKLVKSVYQLTDTFPNEEKYGMTSQFRRACISISSNIVEGSTRWSRKNQARFYEIAFGSLIEVLNQTILSCDLNFIKDDALKNIRADIDTIGRMLNSLYQSTQKPIYLSTKNPSTKKIISE